MSGESEVKQTSVEMYVKTTKDLRCINIHIEKKHTQMYTREKDAC